MTIEETIQKAIEGGYDGYPKPFCLECGNPATMESKYCVIFLDPKWWQALGKSLGWDSEEYSSFQGKRWCIIWKRFIDHLIKGKDIVSFFHEPFFNSHN